MRWMMTLSTVAGLAVLAGILWNTEGRELLERVNLAPDQSTQPQRIDVDTLIKLSDPQLMEELVGAANQHPEPSDIATLSTDNSLVFVGSDVDDADLAQAIHEWEQRLAAQSAVGAPRPQFAGRTASSYGSQSTTGVRSGVNSSVNDYKYIPRMQRFGLINTNRYGRVNAFGKRSLFERSRFGQQSRELDRLRSKYDQHVGGRTVVRD